SLTYVPMASALFLGKKISTKEGISGRIIGFLERAHAPVLSFSLRNRSLLLTLTVVVVAVSLYLFSRMGGEFIPTLEEGDLAAQMTLAPGSSLNESVESSTKAEKILLDNFPEVIEVVSKIGTAEVPTDPMSIEDADIMIILKKKSEWTSAKTREELVDKMKEKLAVLPGLSFEFQQPIQLRFNELMTGVKADVAVKIYGEDLDILFDQATEAAGYIKDVEGAGDVKVEQIVGLPQLVIHYKRDEIARYGLNINDVNRIIKMAYAGESAGVIFEGERRFDLVVRLCEECRNEFKSIQNLRINPPSGEMILLSQVADISIEQGPMQISRDDTRRRITIGINVRNRDVESFVNEVNEVLTEKMMLPPGYYITYGGQFENLQEARKTSSVAVPIALVAILILLYFAFHSIKQALMIFTAIPLAAVGGILALYLRGMPFSISAGVGFIALFGVAVLNGIVLISYYNQLKSEGVSDLIERVKRGTRVRLRPVIMTASVAALGFFPMALSTAPGAEVQKPLATVVIGGLVTSTFLTLVILPVIYVVFNRKRKMKKNTLVTMITILLVSGSSLLHAQSEPLSLEKAISMAIENNLSLENAGLKVDAATKLKKTAFELPPAEFDYENGQINSDLIDYSWSVKQPFYFPTRYTTGSRYQEAFLNMNENEYNVVKAQLIRDVKLKYIEWLQLAEIQELLARKDSLYRRLKQTSQFLFETGSIDRLTLMMAETESGRVTNSLIEVEAEHARIEQELMKLINAEGEFVAEETLMKLPLPLVEPDTVTQVNTRISYLESMARFKEQAYKKQRSHYFPDLYVGYFNQSIDHTTGFEGFQLGATLPIWFWSNAGEVKAGKLEATMVRNMIDQELDFFKRDLENNLEVLSGYARSIEYFETDALKQSDLIVANTIASYESGNIAFAGYVQNMALAFNIRFEYLETLRKYNESVIQTEFLLSK
ncbi:MAG: CusA/CzcA family heavy metal efflux RND transporter, partial [Bacteroidales bacterium]|nr:CusA/CzcA family heavy metal efflux RND transporter [Bacteroidales bacterium]